MTQKRVFPKKEVPVKAEDYFGGARFERSSPDLASKDVKSVNLEISFEEALKLSLAMQTCLQQLNRYNRGHSSGKSMGLLLSIKTENSSITVIEASVGKRSK